MAFQPPHRLAVYGDGRHMLLRDLKGARVVEDILAWLADTIDGKFPASFALGLMTKDVRLANQLGRDTGVPMILGRIVEELHNVAMNNHGADACSNILIKDFEQRAKTRVTK